MSASPSAANVGPAPAQVRAELERILASDLFARSERLSAFLRFIVDATLRGDGAALKEHVIAVELYGKATDFSGAADPIVRVDARRLRDKLREYYATVEPGAIVITVRKGSYAPAFELAVAPAVGRSAPVVQPIGRVAPVFQAVPRAGWRRLAAVVVVPLVTAGVAWLAVADGARDAASTTRLLTVTSFPGAEDDPTLSPDGNFVAFAWSGSATSDLKSIWLTTADGDGLRRLTSSGFHDKWPQWSPDGRHLAYTRDVRGRSSIHLLSPLGGSDRKVADGAMASWAPDSRALVMVLTDTNGRSSIVHHALDTGVQRKLTSADPGFQEVHPRVSPDATAVAFHRVGAGRSAIFVVSIGGGEPRIVGGWANGVIGGLTWTPDSREIIYARPEVSGRRMVRTTLDARSPTPVSDVPLGSTGPAAQWVQPGRPYRLVFASGQVDVGLRLIDLTPASHAQPLGDSALADATRMDSPGRFSPDGRQVAFVSDRGGTPQVWITGREGAPRSVTRFHSATINVGAWAPDSQRLVFDATVGDVTDLYVVRVDSGELKRLTEGPAIEMDAEWSRDGAWIYYSSDVSGIPTIWKMPVQGGRPVQVSRETGFEPREAPDGRHVYFVDERRRSSRAIPATLRRISSGGGPAEALLTNVTPGGWDVTDSGIVFMPGRGGLAPNEPDAIMRYDFSDGQLRAVGTLRFPVAPAFVSRFLVVSRDGRWAVASHLDRFERDIMILDHLRQ